MFVVVILNRFRRFTKERKKTILRFRYVRPNYYEFNLFVRIPVELTALSFDSCPFSCTVLVVGRCRTACGFNEFARFCTDENDLVENAFTDRYAEWFYSFIKRRVFFVLVQRSRE